jgi:hypothetical protein
MREILSPITAIRNSHKTVRTECRRDDLAGMEGRLHAATKRSNSMKSGNRKESRDHILRNLWLKHGCPERMTIHVRKTGETIRLINGLPVTLTQENNPLSMNGSRAQNRESMARQSVTLTRVCKACRNEFSALRKNAQFCSARCRAKFHREEQMCRNRQEAEYLLSTIHNEPAPPGGQV